MVDIYNLTPGQDEVANRFIDALLRGEAVSRFDFPEMDGDAFDELAQAILAAALPERH